MREGQKERKKERKWNKKEMGKTQIWKTE